ncbi:restriction endonuclease subunit S [uncultured Desulfobacter sp.]|uniref:restriction endonuclease subunit S n=1 Tax=uncultured Desulfobacter sp. TaxID=240139 RepID=UPI002AA6154C|nr:restriction endonuclease subunit S [uncultured Desulfobacter sp.]
MGSDYPTKALKDVGVKLYDCVHATPKATQKGYPYIAIPNIQESRISLNDVRVISKKDYAEWTKKLKPQEGDVIVTRRGRVGDIATIPKGLECAIGQNLIILRSEGDQVSQRYLRWVLSGPQYKIEVAKYLNVGAVFDSLNCRDIPKFELPFPDIDKQKSIAAFFDSIQEKIELNQQLNQTLEQISQAIFKSWFVDFEPVKAKEHIRKMGGNSDQIEKVAQSIISGAVNLDDILKGSDLTDINAKIESKLDAKIELRTNEQKNELVETAKLFPSSLIESELGLIPEGCACSNVKNILKRLRPPKRYTKKQVQPYGEVPVFEQGAGLLLGFHDDPPGFEPTLNNPIFIFGDHTCLMHLSISPFDISQNVIPIQGKARSTIWVYYAVKDLQKFQEYRRHWSELIVKKIVISPKPLCTVFEKVVTTNHLKIEKNHIQNKELKRIRDALLPKLLSGEIKVNV